MKISKKESFKRINKFCIVLPGDLIDQGGRTLDIVKLRHPATGESAMFLFSQNNETVQELITFSEDKR